MDSDTVRAAVRELRVREERVSVRAVHALTGGSFRDISRLLRNAREYLADDEVVALEAEAAEPSAAPVPGRLVEAHEACLAADATVGEAQAGLDAAVARLRALRARRPPDATSPEDVAAVVQAQLAHDAEVAALVREIEQWQRLVEARRLEAQGAKEAWRTVQLRVRHLRDDVVPPMRQRLQEAQQDLERLERDTAHQLQLARNRVESLTRALAAHEAELQTLTGDARPDQARR